MEVLTLWNTIMVNGVLFLGADSAVFGHRKEGTEEVTKEGLKLPRVKRAAWLKGYNHRLVFCHQLC
jgi:hypothetical protein